MLWSLNLQIKTFQIYNNKHLHTYMKESITSKEAVSDPRFVEALSTSIYNWIWNQSKCQTRRRPIHRVNHQMTKASSTAKFWEIEANHQVEWSLKIMKEKDILDNKALISTTRTSKRVTRCQSWAGKMLKWYKLSMAWDRIIMFATLNVHLQNID